MEKMKSFILSLVMFFTFSIGMNAQLMPNGGVISYEQVGWVRLDNKSINSSYNVSYYTVQANHVFVIEVYGEKIEGDNNVMVLCFDDGCVIKLYQDMSAVDCYYNPLYKRYIDFTRLFYVLDDESIVMLKSQKLVNMRIEFGDASYKDISLIDRGEKIKVWFNKCYDKATQIIDKRSNELN